MGPRERREAVRGAFRVDPKRKAELKGRAVILVDDVYTSGATANACARVLKRAGAARGEHPVLGARCPRRATIDISEGGPHFLGEEKRMARVEIYTKIFCSYCARAKRLLGAKGVDYRGI